MSEILITILVIIILPLGLSLIYNGIVECKNNNIFGVLLLTISLPIIGTFIGCMIIYKNQHPEFKFWKSLNNKLKNNFIKPKQINISPQF